MAAIAPALQAQAGEVRVREVMSKGDVRRFRNAGQTLLNPIHEVKP